MALEIQLGVFIAFLVFPAATFLFLLRVKEWHLTNFLLFLVMGIFGLIALGGLALMMFANYNVVQSTTQAGYTMQDVDRNGTGSITSNRTITVPEITNKTPIIDSFQTIWGWIFFALVIIYGVLYFYVLATGGRGG